MSIPSSDESVGASSSSTMTALPVTVAVASTLTNALPSAATPIAAASVITPAHRLLLSQILGYTVSLGSFVVKLPQLLTLLRSQSTVGLSLSMYSVELFSQSIAVLYHRVHRFPLATYGENISLGLGNMAILACFVKMNRDPRAMVSLLFPLLLSPLTRYPSFLSFLQSLSIPLNIFSKLPQILINYHVALVLEKQIEKAKAELSNSTAAAIGRTNSISDAIGTTTASTAAALTPSPSTLVPNSASSTSLSALTGTTLRRSSTSTSQLSSVPFALNFLGSFSRLYTTFTECDGDRLMLFGFFISCLLNGSIVLQCLQMNRLQQELNQLRERTTTTTTSTRS